MASYKQPLLRGEEINNVDLGVFFYCGDHTEGILISISLLLLLLFYGFSYLAYTLTSETRHLSQIF